jgi:hypothetical protein
MTKAAIGFRVHSGWSAQVVMAAGPRWPVVIDRRRIELADAAIPGSMQPYHAAEPMKLKDAEAHIQRSIDQARLLAQRALHAAIDEVRKSGHEVAGCGILLASGRPAPTLASILASHALIHTAEGELFRDALKYASERCKLPVTEVKERDLFERAAAALRIPCGELQRRVAEMGRAIGPPWRQDQKLAALVGWLALAGDVTL